MKKKIYYMWATGSGNFNYSDKYVSKRQDIRSRT